MRLLLSFFLFSITVMPALAGHPVTLRPSTELTSEAIRLSHVFDGVPAGLDRDIALSPTAGQSVTYDVRVLTRLAKKYRLDWEATSYTDHAILSRAANYLTLDMIQPEVISELQEHFTDKNTSYEVTFDNRSFSMAFPAEHAPDYKLINFSYDKRSKRFKAEILAKTGATALHKPLSGRVLVKRSIPVLAKKLKVGTIIGTHDLKREWVQDIKIGKDVLTATADILGQEMRQAHPAGSVIRARDIAAPRMVLRGSIVTMKIQTPAMLITAQGRALQDGTKGEVVRIKNMQSMRIIEATVTADGIVQVNAGSVKQIAAL